MRHNRYDGFFRVISEMQRLSMPIRSGQKPLQILLLLLYLAPALRVVFSITAEKKAEAQIVRV